MMRRQFATMLISLALCLPALAQQQPPQSVRPMTPIDMVELTRLSNADLSPDGKYLVYRRSQTDWDENAIVNRYRLIDMSTGAQLPVPTPETDDESFGAAYWRPDSAGFVTLLEREEDEFDQAYYYDIATQSLERLTDHGASISQILWRPDSASFFFVAEKQRDEEERNLRDGDWIIPAYDGAANREIWRFDIASGMASPVFSGDFSVRRVSLDRDGGTLLFLLVPRHELDRVHEGEIWSYDVETGEKKPWTDNSYTEMNPRLSPDRQSIAYIATVNESGAPYYEDKVFIQKEGAAEPIRLLGDLPMEALDFSWSAEGDGLYILGNTGLRTDLYYFDIASASLTALTQGDHAVKGWVYNAKTKTHIARFDNAKSPGDYHILVDGEKDFAKVTSEYDTLRNTIALPKQEAVSWRGRQGVEIEGLLIYPIGYEPGKRYPLVTISHGGPRSSSQFGAWNISRYVPVLAGEGYMVLLPNYRGGTGYGDAFMRDMYGAYFRNSHHDVMDGVDAMIERGLADPERLIKMGWSAGGHMVNKIITHTNRFKAASSGAGASDWLSMHGESDVRHNRAFIFGGTPWERNGKVRQYRKDSPLKDAWRVTTPTLFFVGERDVRVPPTQSIMMYRGVRAAGAATALYEADGEPHNFRKPSHQLFKINTELQWYAKYALGETYAAILPDAAHKIEDDEDTEAE